MNENHYVDIGVVRIQSWLARTPKLRGRRGGSTLITQATDPEEISGVLNGIGDIASINDETGRVDGVVSLKLNDPDRSDEAERAVVRHLRQHMPGVSVSVTKAQGPNYAKARVESTEPSQEWPAPVAEWPAGRRCEWCSTWPAVPREHRAGEQEPICAECVSRSKAAGRAERREQTPYAEKHLLEKLDTELAVPDEFETLARLGGKRETHLAFVYADGNGIGRFIRETLQNSKVSKQYNLKISQKIDNATWESLVSSVREIQRDHDGKLPIVPHTVGGDDVLVSVPARRAWQFVHALLDAFNQQVRQQLKTSTGPSLSAGVVLHHYTLPLFQINELAKRALRQAKVATYGQAASLAWHDTTRDGHEPIDRSAVKFEDLKAYWNALSQLAALPNSARKQLDDVASAFGQESTELHEHARRVDSAPVVRPFRQGGSPIDLVDALGMARWWWK